MEKLTGNEETVPQGEVYPEMSHFKIQMLQEGTRDYVKVGCGEGKLNELEELLWQVLVAVQGEVFRTAKGLEFTYYIKGNEMFVSRKDKSLTRATVTLAFRTALAMQRNGESVSGPKKLKTFGASYLYPVFQQIGVILGEKK